MKNRAGRISRVLSLAITLASAAVGQNQNRTTPGEFVIENPTLINLGFEWMIAGDDNRNAQVEVQYRKQGDSNWRQAMPLLRLHRTHLSG